MCGSTTNKYPDKLYIHVPKCPKRRKQWLQLARRDPKFTSNRSVIYFCQDHFDLPNDMENYFRYNVMGSVSKIRMKRDCLPSKFECQPDRIKRTGTPQPRSAVNKRRRIDIIQEIISKESGIPTKSGMKTISDALSSLDDVKAQTLMESTIEHTFFVPINLQQIKQEFSTTDDETKILDDALNIPPTELNIKEEIIKEEPLSYKELKSKEMADLVPSIKIENSEDVAVVVNVKNKILNDKDVMNEQREGAENFTYKLDIEEMKLGASEDIHGKQFKGAAPARKCKETHMKTQDRRPGKHYIPEEQRKHRAAKEIESLNTNTSVNMSTETTAVTLQVSKNTSRYSDTAINNVGSDKRCTDTVTDVNNSGGEHLNRIFISNNDVYLKHIELHNVAKRTNKKSEERAIQECKVLRQTGVVNKLKETHTGKYSFECDICQRRFARKGNLDRHLRIHTNDNPFQCTICQRRFIGKRHLDGHLRTHAKEKLFKCHVCQRRFTQKVHLHEHLRTHTGETPFECAICQQRFAFKRNLDGHLRIHTKEKPFECVICQRRFTRKEHLDGHLKTHTKEKPFECSVCEQRFTRKDNLDRHLRNTHSRKTFLNTPCANEDLLKKVNLNYSIPKITK